MRLVSLAFLVSVYLLPAGAFAEDVPAQPLTRADCTGAGMLWDDSVNVCARSSQQAQAAPNVAPEVNSAQPLTRESCDAAGMSWNDTTNVCAALSETSAIQSVVPISITIDKASQLMQVSIGGIEHYSWPVSTGARGYDTPSGTFKTSSMNEVWYSKQWDNAPMPHAIFFTQNGHAIHGTYDTKRLGRAVSHGCVRLAPNNASTLYALVEQHGLGNTTVLIVGEGQIAQPRQRTRRPLIGQVAHGPEEQVDTQARRRCGLFGRRCRNRY
jgi:lipoprotein-anchoring transpeptidase ErfK/SrfK